MLDHSLLPHLELLSCVPCPHSVILLAPSYIDFPHTQPSLRSIMEATLFPSTLHPLNQSFTFLLQQGSSQPWSAPGFTVESQHLHSLISSGARVQILFLVFNTYFFTGSFYLLCNKSSPSLKITLQFYPISCRPFTHKLIWKVAMVTLFTCTPFTPWATTSWLLGPIPTLSPNCSWKSK